VRKLLLLTAVPLVLALAGIDALTTLPLDHAAIRYAKDPAHGPVEALRRQLEKREIKLQYHPDFGYLDSLLKALGVPASSQLLVFSKTSFQAPRISPRMARAIYHSDDISVGFVRGGDILEIASVDPQQGVVFYTLDQEESSQPSLVRRGECLQCHVGASTLGVPGLVVRSVHAERTGYALLSAPAFVTDHTSPLAQRWGGWYVTGLHGGQLHMGNQTVESRDLPELDLSRGANVTDLTRYLDKDAYLQPTSDIVSLMVLEHKTRMTNLITRLGWETRIAVEEARGAELPAGARQKLDATAAELVFYMLFAGEAPLTEPIRGADRYAAEFTARGPKDRKGRSLRELDMKTRMFRYPCSFLIYSAQFDALPQPAKSRVYRRLFDGLRAENQSAGPSTSAADREAVLEILRDTKKDLPAYWMSGATAQTRRSLAGAER
jgi:hypothetical protein